MIRGGGSPNRPMLQAVTEALRPILDSLTFVGGQVIELLITDPATISVRATQDVDAVVPVASISEYDRVGERLRQLGFRNDMREGSPICTSSPSWPAARNYWTSWKTSLRNYAAGSAPR